MTLENGQIFMYQGEMTFKFKNINKDPFLSCTCLMDNSLDYLFFALLWWQKTKFLKSRVVFKIFTYVYVDVLITTLRLIDIQKGGNGWGSNFRRYSTPKCS